ncbi:Sec-independent protein translocase subunit TatA [Arthrobacter sp. BHU FT2]|nr:Sec-independent protein translocase subunit TatA [Arthrobacter sp. BHU FT2]
MGRLFDGPWPILIIVVMALLLFAAPKLPVMARSLGQSMRIIKSEVREMKSDDSMLSPKDAPPATDI